jgi:plasmid stabilization system protein ParE
MAKIIWSDQSLEDLKAIADYIAKDSPRYAGVFLENIFQYSETLTLFPAMGRNVPEVDDKNVREIFYKRYRIIYEYKGDAVEVLTVIHGSKLLKL